MRAGDLDYRPPILVRIGSGVAFKCGRQYRGLDTPLEEMGEAELRDLCEEVEWATNLDEEAPSSDR